MHMKISCFTVTNKRPPVEMTRLKHHHPIFIPRSSNNNSVVPYYSLTDIDLMMSDIAYNTGSPIMRGYVLPLEFQVTLAHTSGIYPVVLQLNDARNFQVHYFVSTVDVTDGTQPMEDGITHMTTLNKTNAQRAIATGANITLVMEVVIAINLTECLDMNFLCFIVTNHETASYNELSLVDNCLCIDVATVRECSPGNK